ncbi:MULTISPECIES: Do family serine endopeptidase [unclassified Lysobacter]|uniref:Do family serine endopeptidase n=1 Tax=unclassified Lysobacter TaxID=2635362 RepID=UPI001BE55360|nr:MULTISPECIES: Do family serine endopeptidase [unclassified Lysobacter]MBT2745521.1 Do family serine endopeptidase [Lysobacter sp. ISL-42]MBT2753460.1 Do family serine endopeptidase [Lysobacter sp. ISL-50]MBT2777156.1 Do family serine endopeptidase [Lysobacter sp. ISL-54]MBT2780218.1 Do family serine endopeptidase [Lysobacter sp. ISL-52]
MRPLPTLMTLALAAAFGGFAATAIRDGLQAPAQASPAASALLPVPTTAALPASVSGQALPSLAPMLQKVTPAVVSVHTKQTVRIRNPFANDPIFRRMFPNIPQERINESLGSGVIIDARNGYVLTNHHVIEGADEVSVTLADGRTVKADFIGSDPDTDVALMRIPAQNLSAIVLADSDGLKVGDFVVAVGNPFGIGQTVTSGIVSAVGRSGLRGLGYQNFIQTDASINPGNSGGALVNLNGELVGINTASFNPQGSMAGNIGLGFAIPVNLARNIKDQLIANNGVVRRGTLGLETQDVTPQLAAGLKLGEARGALVSRVFAGSAAAAAGLKPGDVILGANGQRLDGRDALRNFEGLQSIGSKIALEVRRDGQPLQLNATLREQPKSIAGTELDPRLSGATFGELPERLRQSGFSGVVVENVARGSRAEANNLRKDDIVLAASSGEFDDLPGFRASFTRNPAQLILRIQRGNGGGNLQMQ